MNIQKITCSLVASVMLAQPFQAKAVNLGDAFSNLVSPGAVSTVNQPGRYQSGARTGFSAGGFDIRVPRAAHAPSLISASMPSVDIGCGGISAHFGGLSFINGEEFAQLLKGIGSGAALGFVSALTMKTLCPPCEAIVQEMKSAAQAAARLAKDSCQWGAEWGAEVAKGLGKGNNTLGFCTTGTKYANMAPDTLDAQNKLCSTLTKAAENIKKIYNPGGKSTDTVAQQKAYQCATSVGNQTWAGLTAYDAQNTATSSAPTDEAYRRKLLLLNIMGAYFNTDGSKDAKGMTYGCQLNDNSTLPKSEQTAASEAASGQTGFFCPPPIDHKKAVSLFMCGEPSALESSQNTMSKALFEACNDMLTNKEKSGEYVVGDAKLWTCKGGDDADTMKDARTYCSNLVLADAKNVVNGEGFIIKINRILNHAVKKVRMNEPYDTSNEMDRSVIGLLQTAPYPLYQVVNAAAIYPAAASSLLDSITILLGEQFSYAYFDDMLRIEGRTSGNVGCFSPGNMREMIGFLEKYRALNLARKNEIGQNLAIQQAIQEQIRQVNIAIQRQVLTSDMLGSSNYANAVNRSIVGAPAPAQNK